MALLKSIETEFKNRDLWFWVLGIGLFYLMRNDLKDFFADREKDHAGTDPIARLAAFIHDAFNPSGVDILINFDGTRTSSLYEYAGQIKDYVSVAGSYKVQFRENLTDRLNRELTAEEFKKFFDIVAAGGGGTPPKASSAIGKTAVAATAVNVLDFNASTKVAKTAKAGETLGKVVSSAQFNTKTGYVEYWVIEWTTWVFFTSKGYIEKTKVYLQ